MVFFPLALLDTEILFICVDTGEGLAVNIKGITKELEYGTCVDV